MFADVDGELLGSALSLDVWNMTGIRRGQADPGVSELATSSSSGLGAAPYVPSLCAVPFVPFALSPLCPLLCPTVPFALSPLQTIVISPVCCCIQWSDCWLSSACWFTSIAGCLKG